MTLQRFCLQDSVFPTDANLTLKQLMNWTFLVDSINFNFWTMDKEPKYVVSHGKTVSAPIYSYYHFPT